MTVTGNRVRPARCGTWDGIIRAELIRTRHSAVQWFPAVGLVLGAISSALAIATAGAPNADVIIFWQSMYVTGMAMPLMALLAALAETRERRARSGGTDLRPVSPVRVRAGRLLVLCAVSVVFHGANFGVTWLFVLLGGVEGSGRVFTTGLLAWIGSLGVIAVAGVVARFSGMIPVLVLAVIAQVAGTLVAESETWWAFPPSWPIRLLLPVLGVHANAVPLAPGESISGGDPLGAPTALILTLCLIVVAGAVSVFVSVPRGRHPRRRGRRSDRTTAGEPHGGLASGVLPAPSPGPRSSGMTRTGAVAGVTLALRRTLAAPAVLSAVLLIVVVAAVYPPSYVTQLWTFVLLPLGAGLLPVITWPVMARTWRVTVLENHRSAGAYLLWQVGVVVTLSVAAAGGALAAGAASSDVRWSVVLSVLTGAVLVFVSTALCVRVGTATAVAATTVWTVVSLTLGGDVLADTGLWIIALPSWPETALSGGRSLVALAVLTGLSVVSAAWARREFRAFERRGEG